MQDDPLSQLRDIHLPTEPSWWPPAPGWWIAALLAVAATIFLILKLRNRWRAGRPRRLALAELALAKQAQAQGAISTTEYLHQCNALIKRLWVRSLGHAEGASLTGTAWLQYLDAVHGSDAFTNGAGQVLGEARFAAESPDLKPEFHELVKRLLEREPVEQSS